MGTEKLLLPPEPTSIGRLGAVCAKAATGSKQTAAKRAAVALLATTPVDGANEEMTVRMYGLYTFSL